MTGRTWEKLELPLLEAIAKDEEEGPTFLLDSDTLASRTSLAPRHARIALRALLEDGCIKGTKLNDGPPNEGSVVGIRLTPDGRRRVGQWPSGDPYQELIRLLDNRLARTEDESERSSLRRLRDALTDVGRGVVSAPIYDVGRKMTGVP